MRPRSDCCSKSWLSRVSRWGVWRSDYGLEVLAVNKWEVRRDLTGVVFTTSTAHEPPYVDVSHINNNKNVLPTGYQAGYYDNNVSDKYSL